MTSEERAVAMARRLQLQRPWHSPPRFDCEGHRDYHLSAACYEHRPHIGNSLDRMHQFSDALLVLAACAGVTIHAWCVLPNHYHLLVGLDDLRGFVAELGRLHGRSSYQWNGEDGTRGWQVFCSVSDRAIRSESHFWATVNYVHHNPVKHGYATDWHEWAWSSAAEYLARVGREEATRVWERYPILEYGAGWDV
jgi:REP-associated tyrosine transposase